MKAGFWVLAGTVFITIFTQISFNVELSELQIPVTGQSFAVLLWAYVFGWRTGLLSVILYLFLGIAGLPVFADGKFGFGVVTGNSGGFLIGFVLAALLTGWMAEFWRNTWVTAFLAMVLGTVVILFTGILRLCVSFGFEKAVEYGFIPFWPGALFKIFTGTLAVLFIRKFTTKKTAS